MANWDKIYRDFRKGGEVWATLKGKIDPRFKQFLNKSNFEYKRALDIGCGAGNYLNYLINRGFNADGVDSSPTAVKITKELLDKRTGNIKVANMFKLRIGKNEYDLIISIATIQHGRKKDIKKLINKIHSALVENGKVFITLPDLESSKRWHTFKKNKDLGNGTFAPLSGPEKGLPHSFFTKAEIQKLFAKFQKVKISLDKIGRWAVQASK